MEIMPRLPPEIVPIGNDVVPGAIVRGRMRDTIYAHVLELGMALAWFLIGANYLLDRESGERSSIGQALPNYDVWWSASFVIAGPLIFLGIFNAVQNVRVAGLVLLASGLFMNGIAAFSVDPIELRDSIYWIYAAICLIKAYAAFRFLVPKDQRRAPE